MDHDAELDAILEQVEAAGLVEQFTDEDGKQAMRLTPDGVRVADPDYAVVRRVIAPGESLETYLLFRQPATGTTGRGLGRGRRSGGTRRGKGAREFRGGDGTVRMVTT